MTALGTHILLDLRACDHALLNDVAEVRRTSIKVLDREGMELRLRANGADVTADVLP